MLKNSLNNYVVSTRVRLARNINGFKFVPCITIDDAKKVVQEVSAPLLKQSGYRLVELSKLGDNEVSALKERHLISNALIKNRRASAVVLDGASQIAVMINEEDHIRIQAILSGLELEKAYEYANKTDDIIAETVPPVFDSRLGYVTSCPTNLGTGMRASVMMFLPALNLNKTIGSVLSTNAMQSMTFRGVYGEGTDAEGFMYQLSNKHTLGLSEQEILDQVRTCINMIAQAEEIARLSLYSKNKTYLTDKIMRAWGLLTNSYTMASAEFIDLISYVKLGVSLGIVAIANPSSLDKLIIDCQPACFSALTGGTDDADLRDIRRAEYLKNQLPKLL